MTPDDIQRMIDRETPPFEAQVQAALDEFESSSAQLALVSKDEADELTRVVYGDEVADLEALFALERS